MERAAVSHQCGQPETADEVPNYISSVELSALDFRDTVLYARPDADFTGDESEWIGEITHDESGRVASAVLGGEAQRYGAAQPVFPPQPSPWSTPAAAFSLPSRASATA